MFGLYVEVFFGMAKHTAIALAIPVALAVVLLTSQSASANMIGGFDCFGESGCVSGWDHAISQAQTDWNSGQYTQIQNGGNPDCFTGHTQASCNGYTKAYTYEWNKLYQLSQPKPTSPSLPHFEFCNKGRCTSMGNGTCTVIANGSCVPTSASNMTGNYTDKGNALGSLGNYSGAIEYYDKALAIDPHYVYALTGKGLALGSLGNYAGAIIYYDKALAINPNYQVALNGKGNALYNLGNYTGAIIYYDKALAIDPKDTYALNGLVEVEYKVRQSDVFLTTQGESTLKIFGE